MKVEGVEYDLVMLDEFEYVVEFPVRFSGKDEYKIKVSSNGLLVPIYFTRKFNRLPKDFQRAVLLVNIRYEAGEFDRFGCFNGGQFWTTMRAKEWVEGDGSLPEQSVFVFDPPIQHGPSFYITFRTGKYPKANRYYPTKKEYEQMKKGQKTNGKIKESVVVLGAEGV